MKEQIHQTGYFKRPKYIIVVLLLFGAFIMMMCTTQSSQNDSKTLKVLYRFDSFRSDAIIIHYENLSSIFQYYLLENLSAGLLRDRAQNLSGYEGVLVKNWTQKNPSTWVFELKKDLKWSDGSEITPEQIISHYQKLSHKKNRHLFNLQSLQKIDYKESSHELIFCFSNPTNRSVLHEFSLADAVLLHPSNLEKGWAITSGPYSVSSYDPDKKWLELKANPYSTLQTALSPKNIQLFQPPSNQTSMAFTTVDTDLFPVPILHFAKKYGAAIEHSPQQLKSPPVYTYYFLFNPDHPMTQDTDSRKAFAFLVDQAFDGYQVEQAQFGHERQFVPKGYPGRLDTVTVTPVPLSPLKGKTLELNLFPVFTEIPIPWQNLQKLAEQAGIRLKYSYDVWTPKDGTNKNEFARTTAFKGNQKDALGSWSYLLNRENGDLKHYRKKLLPYLMEASQNTSEQIKASSLQQLHRFILEEALLVPFASEPELILHSNRISLERWNVFDMRFRFYDVIWK